MSGVGIKLFKIFSLSEVMLIADQFVLVVTGNTQLWHGSGITFIASGQMQSNVTLIELGLGQVPNPNMTQGSEVCHTPPRTWGFDA